MPKRDVIWKRRGETLHFYSDGPKRPSPEGRRLIGQDLSTAKRRRPSLFEFYIMTEVIVHSDDFSIIMIPLVQLEHVAFAASEGE